MGFGDASAIELGYASRFIRSQVTAQRLQLVSVRSATRKMSGQYLYDWLIRLLLAIDCLQKDYLSNVNANDYPRVINAQ
jgi:hypothetical protein